MAKVKQPQVFRVNSPTGVYVMDDGGALRRVPQGEEIMEGDIAPNVATAWLQARVIENINPKEQKKDETLQQQSDDPPANNGGGGDTPKPGSETPETTKITDPKKK